MSAIVIGYEGSKLPASRVSWGAAAIKDGDLLRNGGSGLTQPYRQEEIDALVTSGALTRFKNHIELAYHRSEDRPLVVALHPEFISEAGIYELRPKVGLRAEATTDEGWSVYVFADEAALNAYRDRVACSVIQQALKMHPEHTSSEIYQFLTEGLILHGHDGALNAAAAFYDPDFGDDREFALELALARLRTNVENDIAKALFRALESAEASTRDEKAGQLADRAQYKIEYQNGIASGGGLGIPSAASLFSDLSVLDRVARDEAKRQFPFLEKDQPSQVNALLPGSASLVFASAIKGESFSDRVSRYLKLTVLEELVDGKRADLVEQKGPAVVNSLRRVVQPTPETQAQHKLIARTALQPIGSTRHLETFERGEPVGPVTSEPMALLGYQSGLLDDWGKLEICIAPGTRIRLDSRKNDLEHPPVGIDTFLERDDFLFRPAIFTLVRERRDNGKPKYWLREARLIEDGAEATVTAIPSFVVDDAFLTRLSATVEIATRTMTIEASKTRKWSSRIKKATLTNAQEWMLKYDEDFRMGLELDELKPIRIGPIYMPSPTALQRIAVVLHEEGEELSSSALIERVRALFHDDVSVKPESLVKKFPQYLENPREDIIALTDLGKKFAKAYLAIETKSVTARKRRNP